MNQTFCKFLPTNFCSKFLQQICLISAANFCCNKNFCLSNKFLQKFVGLLQYKFLLQSNKFLHKISAIQIAAANLLGCCNTNFYHNPTNFCNTNFCNKFCCNATNFWKKNFCSKFLLHISAVPLHTVTVLLHISAAHSHNS